MREIARKHGVRYDDLRGTARNKWLFAARVEAAKAMHDIGFNGPKIARLMRKDHTTIYLYLGRIGRRKPQAAPQTREVA